VELLLPPVDVHHNAPGVVDPAPFRKQYGIESSDITVVTVSRIVEWLKGESLFQTVEAVRALGRRLPLRLLIAGDGTAREKLQRLADVVNGELGRRAVILVGELLDPRPAYAAADIVVGMGGSALRGMAFGKPAIIVGEQGFSAPFTPETADSFYNSGIYGRGADGRSNHRLIADLRGLAEQPDRLPELGHFSRQFVMRHFALEVVSARFAGFCRDAANSIPGIHVTAADACRTAALYVRERGFLIPSRPPACDLRP
jgi:glycosyltransferase involved in cell wall biosynthesis